MTTRNTSLEMLRITSMIIIIAHHFEVHGFTSDMLIYGTNRYVVDILSMGGILLIFLLVGSVALM